MNRITTTTVTTGGRTTVTTRRTTTKRIGTQQHLTQGTVHLGVIVALLFALGGLGKLVCVIAHTEAGRVLGIGLLVVLAVTLLTVRRGA